MATPPAVVPTLDEAVIELTARIKRGAAEEEILAVVSLIRDAVNDQNELVQVAIDLLRWGHVSEPTQRKYPDVLARILSRSHAVARLAQEVAA